MSCCQRGKDIKDTYGDFSFSSERDPLNLLEEMKVPRNIPDDTPIRAILLEKSLEPEAEVKFIYETYLIQA